MWFGNRAHRYRIFGGSLERILFTVLECFKDDIVDLFGDTSAEKKNPLKQLRLR